MNSLFWAFVIDYLGRKVSRIPKFQFYLFSTSRVPSSSALHAALQLVECLEQISTMSVK